MSMYTRYVNRQIREIVIDPLTRQPTEYMSVAKSTALVRSYLTHHDTPIPVIIEDEYGNELGWECRERGEQWTKN